MTYRETFLYLREINTESKFDSVMRDYDRIVVDDSGVIKKYSVAEFKKLIFPVTHRPRYNHWAKPYKMYEPVKQHKPNLK